MKSQRNSFARFLVVLATLVGIFSGSAVAIDVLYVSANGLTSPGDMLLNDFFVNRGDTVTVIDQGEPAAAMLAASDAADLTYISESVGSGNVTNKVLASTTPVITSEPFLQDDLLYTLNDDCCRSSLDAMQIEIVDSGHPLAAGLSGVVTNYNQLGSIGWGMPTGDVQIVASLAGAPTQATIFAYDAGAALNDGSPAAANRVFIGSVTGLTLVEATTNMNPVWTAEGEALFAAAVDFALPSAPGGGRVNNGMVVGYDFTEGSGTVVGDKSGRGAPLDLTIHDPAAVTWGNGSLTINAATIISSASAPNVAPESTAGKIFDSITASEAITIEAWVKPANLDDNGGPARVATMSTDPTNRNFTMGQDQTSWQTRFRTTDAGNNGSDLRLETEDNITTDLQHVVYTRAADGDAKTYINGAEVPLQPGGQGSGPITGDTSTWDNTYDFALANELTWTDVAQRDWLGEMYLVAVYDRALSAVEVGQNFAAGELAPIPEPSSLLLCFLGFLGICALRRR